MANPAIRISNLTVQYGPLRALDGVSLEIPSGRIVGLVGHNGAGKSTLINAVTGAVRPTAGEILIDGLGVDLSHTENPLYMARRGMRVIHQEPSLAGVLSIADNITLKTPGEKKSKKERLRLAREALKVVGSDLDPGRPVSSLSFGDRQIVDLARSLQGDVKALLLDEPTAALGREETERLHSLLNGLASRGKAIVYVSHRLRDILEVCHQVVVLREGRVVMERPGGEVTPKELSEAVSPGLVLGGEGTGPEGFAAEPAEGSAAGEAAVRVHWQGQTYSFARGEIVGLFGMAGGPQFDFARALYGLEPDHELIVEMEGRICFIGDSRQARDLGIRYVSADRERESLFHLMSALSNLWVPSLDRFCKGGLIFRKSMRREYLAVREMLNITGPDMNAGILKFSGGNRQKHVLGRWLAHTGEIRLLVLCQPNQGVDIGARADIARALRRAAAGGVTVLVASSEVDEISQLASRAYVCETSPWAEVPGGPGFEQALMETLLYGVQRREASDAP